MALAPREPVQTAEGYVLTDTGDTWGAVIALGVFALGWNGFIALFYFLSTRGEDSLPALGLVLLGVFALIGLGLVAIAVNQARIVGSYGPGRLILARWPLRLGEEVELRYQRKMRGMARVQRIEGELICREWVQWRKGKTSDTREEKLWTFALVPTSPRGSTLEPVATWKVHLPEHLPPAFHASHNRIEWVVKLKLTVSRGPGDDSAFHLAVGPEVAPQWPAASKV